LEEIPGIGPKMVERIQAAVVSYYQQFEEVLENGAQTPEAQTLAPEGPPAEEVTAAPPEGDSPEPASEPEGDSPEPASEPEGDSPEPASESDTIKDSG